MSENTPATPADFYEPKTHTAFYSCIGGSLSPIEAANVRAARAYVTYLNNQYPDYTRALVVETATVVREKFDV